MVAIARSPTDVLERAEFKTTTPEETLGKCCAWLKEREYDALGVASFGPVDLDKASPTYGYITTTPKTAWKNTDILGPLLKVRKVPVVFDTDVNAPALAEYLQAQKDSKGLDGNVTSCAYITVGTGIGVGLVVNGAPVRRWGPSQKQNSRGARLGGSSRAHGRSAPPARSTQVPGAARGWLGGSNLIYTRGRDHRALPAPQLCPCPDRSLEPLPPPLTGARLDAPRGRPRLRPSPSH